MVSHKTIIEKETAERGKKKDVQASTKRMEEKQVGCHFLKIQKGGKGGRNQNLKMKIEEMGGEVGKR